MSSRKLSAAEKSVIEMFAYMRPAGTATEQVFIDKYLTPLGFIRDQFHNLVMTVGDKPRILFSSHVDTVHRREGLQTTHYDGTTLRLSKSSKSTAGCLGADDTSGIWLMMEMIKANVPGVYVIHHAEEEGCVGSSALAKGNPEFFKDIDAAIAFDRMGYDSVITHQMGRRTASDAFANSMAAALDKGLGIVGGYKPDDGGAYTDTNEYVELVPECTNISVGYHSQHSSSEEQHIPFLIALRDALVKVDWSSIVIERDPTVSEYVGRYWGGSYGSFQGRPNYDLFDDRDPWDDPKSYIIPDRRSSGSLEDLVSAYPDVAASILASYGMTRTSLMDEISETYGEDALAAV